MGTHEPYWQTNTSFSPPPSRWDFQFQPEGPSFGSHDGLRLYGSSTSSNSRESRSWLRGSYLPGHQYSASDGVGPYFSSPSDISPAQQWTPPVIQEISVDDYASSSRRALGPLFFSPTMEGISAAQDSGSSTSSRSDSSDYDPTVKSQSSYCNFSSRHCFMSKPIYPLSFTSQTINGDASDRRAVRFYEFDAIAAQRERNHLSSMGGDVDFTDVPELFESDNVNRTCNTPDSFKCGLCERFLSQRSPWSSRRIVRSGDMPVAGVLSCCHVFHAECLEQTTPKMHKNDPPCPICFRLEEENSPGLRAFSKLRSGFPRLIRPFREDGPSRPWGCAQAGDCVEGALHAPSRNTMLVLNRHRVKKNLSLKGISGKEFPGKLKKNDSYSSPLFIGPVDQASRLN